MEEVSGAQREAFVEAFYAGWRAAVSTAYGYQVMRGYTIERMAQRVGWTEKKMRRMLLVPRDLTSIRTLAVLCWAMMCEPQMEMRNNRIIITVTPFPCGDAPNSSSPAPEEGK